jgi:5-hydroxyisourate hydrolase
VPVALAVQVANGEWQTLAEATTNADGRASNLLSDPAALAKGVYRLTFDTSAYFHSIGVNSFYPYVTVVFEIQDPAQHYHVPLLLSPFGYSTYRGS